MIYQIRTFGNLCSSKKMFKEYSDLKYHIKEAQEKTNLYRSSVCQQSLRSRGIGVMVTRKELMEGIEILKVDEDLFPAYETFLGPQKEFKDPPQVSSYREKEDAL